MNPSLSRSRQFSGHIRHRRTISTTRKFNNQGNDKNFIATLNEIVRSKRSWNIALNSTISTRLKTHHVEQILLQTLDDSRTLFIQATVNMLLMLISASWYFNQYLLEEVALVPDRLKKIPLQAQRDLFLFLSRFIFFYKLGDKLVSFSRQFPDFPNAFLIGGAADIFVTELADQLQKLKVEPVLLHYLSQLKFLQGLELRMATSTRLKTCLYSFTSPGAPMYPTRAVRHAAWDALDLLYHVGRYPWHIISLFFRLL